jgi:hypothetical protein
MTPGNYFFVHIPKTAGTSFRIALGEDVSVRMLFDYGKKSPESTPELIALNTEEPGRSVLFDPGKANFICGHASYRKYRDYVLPRCVVSILRNPVERVVSEYQHLRRHTGLAADLRAFCSTPVQRDKQWRLLRGLRPRHAGLVGLTSHYGIFLEVASRRLGLSLRSLAVNEAPPADAQERFRIPLPDLKAAYALNRKDLEVFFEYASAFAARVKEAGYCTTPPESAKWSCRIDENAHLVGWLAREPTDCYFLVIRVNGEARAIVALDRERDDVHRKGLSAHPVCGFSYPLAMAGAGPGDEVGVEVMGAPAFSTTFSV